MRAESHTSQRANASMPTRFHDYQGMRVLVNVLAVTSTPSNLVNGLLQTSKSCIKGVVWLIYEPPSCY
ncbi:hypothetical protein FOXYSP1_03044 [Fusarium oxysporum f. sp. phaseoli]